MKSGSVSKCLRSNISQDWGREHSLAPTAYHNFDENYFSDYVTDHKMILSKINYMVLTFETSWSSPWHLLSSSLSLLISASWLCSSSLSRVSLRCNSWHVLLCIQLHRLVMCGIHVISLAVHPSLTSCNCWTLLSHAAQFPGLFDAIALSFLAMFA